MTGSSWENNRPGPAQYRFLMRLADRVMKPAQIDPMERLLVTGAYGHYTEENLTSWLHPTSDYEVYNLSPAHD